MEWFTHNNETNEEGEGELENISPELKQNLAELECEEEIMEDKEEFGRVRTNMMKVLRAKYGPNTANRALSRVNKRIQEGYFESKSIF
ncbi:MAG: hypothetical protein OEM77_06615 [Nitrosopumilus sp.]|nr:hypothetical protein [Nitrosopumilus sp.]MDH3735498.1 hypothetical protein [Nitrosopumilus sp.]MDH3833648.1 hypothetical protein [Nitrosopumilus sp.]